MNVIAAFAGFLVACLVAFTLQVFFTSPISPDALHLPSLSGPQPNNELQKVSKIGEGVIDGPEDLFVDKDGVLYTVTRDGWIKRMRIHGDGSFENWMRIDSSAGLGITPSKDGGVLIADAELGLLKVTDADGPTVLASHINGAEIRFAEELVESSDGTVYLSIPSTKFGYHNWYHDILEAKPNGQILKYDPSTNQTTVLLDNLCFPNGVALPKEEDYLVFCETWKFRCQKHWLTGEKKGKTEIFVENLPGGPDNIHLAPDGSFWIGLIQIVSEGQGFLHASKLLKHLVAWSPKLQDFLSRVLFTKARVVNVGADGSIIRMLDDPSGEVISFVTAAFEFEGHLYLGSLTGKFIGKLPLSGT
ncbi:unnamed protein product [Linum trigynum]|uniref:Strictosidine synthase conserved region domain-containing protein n=1 Tax=Linum trigynum TaxID=586398 RepID=A0AAV2EVT3_9ROSI